MLKNKKDKRLVRAPNKTNDMNCTIKNIYLNIMFINIYKKNTESLGKVEGTLCLWQNAIKRHVEQPGHGTMIAIRNPLEIASLASGSRCIVLIRLDSPMQATYSRVRQVDTPDDGRLTGGCELLGTFKLEKKQFGLPPRFCCLGRHRQSSSCCLILHISNVID